MRVLVCGSRDWTDDLLINCILDGWSNYANNLPFVVIEGQCPKGGADRIAEQWATRGAIACPGEIEHEPYPADWEKHGKAAGPIRNQQMLDEGKPDVVIAFKDGFQADRWRPLPANAEGSTSFLDKAKGGTEDLVRRAKGAGIRTYIVSHG